MHSHYVATGFIYDRHTDRFLLIEHRGLGAWLAPGGHLEDGEEPHLGALREIREEIGQQGRILTLQVEPRVGSSPVPQLPNPFCILAETIPASRKDGEHIHIDFVYAVEIPAGSALSLSEQEVAGARWFSTEEVQSLATFDNVKKVCQAISQVAVSLF